MVLCPNSNLYIGNNLAPAELFRKERINLGLGTYSLASNEELSILSEIKTLQRHFPGIPCGELFSWASRNGAQALGISDQFGTFETGKRPGILLISPVNLKKRLLLTESRVQRLIREGHVTVGGRTVKARHTVQPLEVIRVRLARPRPAEILPESIPLDIVYEDAHLLVVNKADRKNLALKSYHELQALPGVGRRRGDGWIPELILASALEGWGQEALAAALERHLDFLSAGRLDGLRREHRIQWVYLLFAERFGSHGVERLGGEQRILQRLALADLTNPFSALQGLAQELSGG